MSIQQLTDQALALPFSERVSLAQTLWESIHDGLEAQNEEDALAEAVARSEELDSGKEKGIPYEQVKARVQRELGC